jgi:hypothetical protein
MTLVLHDDAKREYAFEADGGLPAIQAGSFSDEL